MSVNQISVFLENRAGQLSAITSVLTAGGIDLRAINIAETSDYGVLRLIAPPQSPEQWLHECGLELLQASNKSGRGF